MATSYFSDQRQFLVSVATATVGKSTLKFPGYWLTLAGGDATVPVVKGRDGGSPTMQIVTGNVDYSDMTLTRNFDAVAFKTWYAALKKGFTSGWAIRSVIKQLPTDSGYSSLGVAPDQWSAQLTGITTPKLDQGKTGASIATLSLVWSVTKLT